MKLASRYMIVKKTFKKYSKIQSESFYRRRRTVVLVYTQHAHLDTPTLRGRPFPLWVSALDSSPEPWNANGEKRQRAELEGELM